MKGEENKKEKLECRKRIKCMGKLSWNSLGVSPNRVFLVHSEKKEKKFPNFVLRSMDIGYISRIYIYIYGYFKP